MTPNKNAPEAQLQELKDKIECWRDEAMDATKGKYGPMPKGKSENYWRGRWDALNDLAAFLPTLGDNYIHRSELTEEIEAIKVLRKAAG